MVIMSMRKLAAYLRSGAGVLVLLVSLPALAQSAPAAFDDLVAQASAARDQNNVSRAIDLYQQAEQLNPRWSDGWWFLGSLDYGTNDYAGAKDALTRYLKLTPSAGPAFALRGLCEFETGDYAQSLQDIERGLSLGAGNQPRNAQILFYHEALLLTLTGQFEAALAKYAWFAKNGIDNPEMLTGIGLAGLRVPVLPKDADAGRQELLQAAGNAAYSFMAGGQATGGPAFQALFQRFPKTVNAHYLYGYLLYPTAPEQATAEFKQELALDPANAAANVMMAWGFIMRGDFPAALPYAEKAEAEEPGRTIAELVAGRSLVETGDVKRGLEYLESAVKQEPGNLEIHIALVKGYAYAGRPDDARRERLLCLQLSKNASTYGAHQ